MRSAPLVLAALTFAPAATARAEGALPAIFVHPSTVAVELVPLLEQELGPEALARAPTSLVLEVFEVDDALVARLDDADGGSLLDRRFPLSSGRLPALRSAVLAVAEARRRAARVLEETAARREDEPGAARLRATPPSPATTSADDRLEVWLGLALASSWAGRAPLTGVEASVLGAYGAWRFGASGGVHGLLCCDTHLDTSANVDALRGSFELQSIRANAELRVLARDRIEVRVAAAVGAEHIEVEVVPVIYPGDEVAYTRSTWAAVARVAPVLAVHLGARIGLRAEVGLEVRSSSPGWSLPAPIFSDVEPLQAGRAVPFAALGAELEVD